MTDRSPHHESSSFKARVSPGLFSPRLLLQQWFSLGLDLLFPPRCIGCGKIDTSLCEICHADIEALPFPQQVRQLPLFAGVASTAHHAGKIREAVQALKYDNARVIARPLGERLARHLASQNWTFDMIVPVPLHTIRLKERGYNQSELLAEIVSQKLGVPCVPTALRRERHTQSQVTMSAAGRLTNVEHAFLAEPSFAAHHRILIVDDVYTTGATLSACAEALLSVGVQAVYGLTVTAAGHYSPQSEKEHMDGRNHSRPQY
jgi:ComF family protein